jgi:hypothetical protein
VMEKPDRALTLLKRRRRQRRRHTLCHRPGASNSTAT